MPKIIENAQGQIQDVAARILAEHGYEKLTMRGVARRCGMAVGTIYNYYSCKDDVVRDVMLRDWAAARAAMEKVAASAVNLPHGLRDFFANLRDFVAAHRETWRVMSMEISARERTEMRYSPAAFREEMDVMLATLLDGTSPRYRQMEKGRQAFIRGFVSKNLVAYSMEPNMDFHHLGEVLVACLA